MRWVGPDFSSDRGAAGVRNTPVQWASHSLKTPHRRHKSSGTDSAVHHERRSSRKMNLSGVSPGTSGDTKRRSHNYINRLDEGEGEDEDELGEQEWLEEIWFTLFSRSGSGHVAMESRALYSIFKRRHELKYTALEISDTRGCPSSYRSGRLGWRITCLGYC